MSSHTTRTDSQFFFFFQAEDGIRDLTVTGVQTCALPILPHARLLGQRPQLGSRIGPPHGERPVMTRNRMTPEEAGGEADQAQGETTAPGIGYGDRDGGGPRPLPGTPPRLRRVRGGGRGGARRPMRGA